MFNKNVTRRDFLSSGTLALAGLSAFPFGSSGRGRESNPRTPLRIGVIGMGDRGVGIASELRRIPDTTVTACCDSLEANLKSGIARAGSKPVGYSDYRRLLEDRNVDAVIITLPLHLHYIVAKEALEAKKHVYLEKTMTYTAEEAISLEKIVKEHPHLVFQVGHQFRYFMLYHKVLEMIKSGHLGKVMQYECQWYRNSDWRRSVKDSALERHVNWRMYKEYSGGLMAELCSHHIDIVNWFTDSRPLQVMAMGGVDYWQDGRETYDNIRAFFEYPNGVKAGVSSILTNAHNGYSIRVLGTRAAVVIEMEKAHIYYEEVAKIQGIVDGVTRATAPPTEEKGAKPVEFMNQDSFNRSPTAYALMDFIACVRSGKKSFADVEIGRNSTIAVHAANRSAEIGTFVECIY